MQQRQPSVRQERLAIRATSEQKRLFERAAALRGCTVSEFVLRSTQDAANATIREQELITLSVRDSLAFAQSLLNPPPPNERLRVAFQRHKERIGS